MSTIATPSRQSGTLDPQFGTGGIVQYSGSKAPFSVRLPLILDEREHIFFMSLDPLPEPTPVIKCLMPSGHPDLLFGAQGETVLGRNIIPAETDYYAMARKHDGCLVAVCSTKVDGSSNKNIYAVQCLPDGLLDESFGHNGVQFVGIYTAPIRDVGVQSDGKILLAGTNAGQGLIIRLKHDGSMDEAWGNQGVASYHLGHGDVAFSQVIPLGEAATERILAFGHDSTGIRNNFIVIRTLGNGDLDQHFAVAGVLREPFPTVDKGLLAEWMMLQPDHKLFISLTILQAQGHTDLWRGRYTEHGDFDPDFNGGHAAHDGFGGGFTARTYTGVVGEDNYVVMTGNKNTNLGKFVPAVFRYQPDGKRRDPDFGTDGVSTVDLWPRDAIGCGMVIQQDGKYVVLVSTGAVEPSVAVLRVLP